MPIILYFLLSACGGSAGDTAGGADTAPAGVGTVTGSFKGRPFDAVGSALRIGRPDDPAQTMVIYLFDKPIPCADIVSPGWDETVIDETQSVEMKIIGTQAGDYPLALGRTPGPGESDANYTLTSTKGTPTETEADTGGVVIDSAENDAATGSFVLSFSSGDTLSGTFSAAPCAQGREP